MGKNGVSSVKRTVHVQWKEARRSSTDSFQNPTAMALSPDGKSLWVPQAFDIVRFTVNSDGTVSNPVTISLPTTGPGGAAGRGGAAGVGRDVQRGHR